MASSSSSKSKYSSIVFSAYVVPTIPLLEGSVGDPNGAGYVSGKYVGIESGDPKDDMKERFRLVEAAANQICDMVPETVRDDDSVLHVFCVPEFMFRGPQGAYHASSSSDSSSPLLTEMIRLIREIADQPKFKNWMFVCGTILESNAGNSSPKIQEDAEVRDNLIQAIIRTYNAAEKDETKDFVFGLLTQATDWAQKNPLFEIENRCVVYKQNSAEYPTGLCVEKRFVSHEDFVVSLYSPQTYSEASVAYPYIDESDGEIKKSAFDSKCLFTMEGLSFGLEICLDHRRARLRTVRKTDESSRIPVDVQLVPSCGMQIQQPSVVARAGGLVFNTDGQYANRDSKASPNDKESIFTGSEDGKGHSQLCVVTQEAVDDIDATVERPTGIKVTTAKLNVPTNMDVSQLEAYGGGEVHLYSKLPLPS